MTLPVRVDDAHLDAAKNMIDSFEKELRDCWDRVESVNDKVDKLNRAASNVYTEFCRKENR